MKKIVKQYSNYIVYMAMFSFFFLVFWQIPLVHDAWAGQVYNQSADFIDWSLDRFAGYFILNGRIVAQIVVGFFERNEIMLDIANAAFMTLLIGTISNVLKRGKKISFIALVWGMILLASINIRTEVYLYATMIYLIPAVLFLGFIWFWQYSKEKTSMSKRKKFWILCILGALNSGWIEHSGFAFAFVMGIYWLGDLVKNRKFNIKFTVFELLNGITFCIMMLSPGLRLQRQITVSSSILELIMTNVGNTVQAIIYEHKVIFFIYICASMIVIHQKSKKKTLLIYGYQIAMSLYAIVFGLNILYDVTTIKLPDAMLLQADMTWKYGGVWSITGIVLVGLLFVPLLYNARKKELIFSYFVGMFSLAPTIVTPNFGHRICYFAFVIIVFLTVGVVADIEWNKKSVATWGKIIAYAILFVQVDAYAILVANINEIQNEREKKIELTKNEQRLGTWDYEKTLILPMFSYEQLYLGASPEPYYDPIHHQVFMEFYGLDPRTLLVFSNHNDELRVAIDEDEVLFEMIPENCEKEYTYVYYILNNGQIVWQSEETENEKKETMMPSENGSYYFKCDMIDEQGTIIETFSASVQVNE